MTDPGSTRLEQLSTPVQPHETVWKFTLTAHDAVAWERERLDMLEDAFWLIQQALAGVTEGPLTLPRMRVPLRDHGQPVGDAATNQPERAMSDEGRSET